MIKKIKLPPENFEQECSSVWSFPRRWNWLTHNTKYRWNWSPEVVRNLILRYSKEWDFLLDPMIGWWTTAIESKILNRNLICYDINPRAIELTKNAIDFEYEKSGKIEIFHHSATEKNENILNESIDFVLMHPPYANIIKYSEWQIEWDLSNISDLEKFCDEIEKVAIESFRVLKKWKFCAVLMWDTRKQKMYQPLAFMVMQRFLKSWFTLKEDIIKIQHNCKETWFWVKKSKESNFLLIMHEHLFIFQKM